MAWRKLPEKLPEPQELPQLPPLPTQRTPAKEPEQPKRRFEVVFKLPTQEVRQYKAEDGTLIDLVTIEEALTEWINARFE